MFVDPEQHPLGSRIGCAAYAEHAASVFKMGVRPVLQKAIAVASAQSTSTSKGITSSTSSIPSDGTSVWYL